MLVLTQTSTASGGASTAGHVPVQGDDSDDDDDDDDDCNDDDNCNDDARPPPVSG